MSTEVFILALIVGLVAVDAAAVAYGVHVGMKYPFIAAAVVNVAITICVHGIMIIRMLTRS